MSFNKYESGFYNLMFTYQTNIPIRAIFSILHS